MLQHSRLFPCLFYFQHLTHYLTHNWFSRNSWMNEQAIISFSTMCQPLCLSPIISLPIFVPHHSDWATITVWLFPRLRVRWSMEEGSCLTNQILILCFHIFPKNKWSNAVFEKAALGEKVSYHVPHMFPNTVSTGSFAFFLPICTHHLKKTVSNKHHSALKFLVLTSSHQRN